jgi:virulence factor
MIRLGILDFDTSHVVEFTTRLNHKHKDKEQWVDGSEVVLGCPGESRIMPERIAGYKKAMEDLGIKLVEKPEDMIGKVDGMLVESQEGGVHWERAKPFLEAGIPCYIDKPFTCSTADAKKIVALAEKKNVAVFSASSLRYVPELTEFVAKEKDNIVGALAYGPATINEKDPTLNPGLYHYGIHAVEILYTLMGPGCQRVANTHEKDVDVATGQWSDGRVATVRGIRKGKGDYGCVVFTKDAVKALPLSTKFIYRELAKQIVAFFTTKKPPVESAVTVEMMAFIEAANKSGMNHGAGEKVAV